MAGQNEDIPYTVSDFATPDTPREQENDVDKKNQSILLDVIAFLKDSLEHDRTTDALDLSKDAPLSLEQQVFISKRDNARLAAAIEFIENKLKEFE
jgi:hypothetical protein